MNEFTELIDELKHECVLDQVRDWLARYIITVGEDDLDLLTLWAVHTHFVDVLYTTPRLVIDSPVPGSGKTTCLEHLQRLSHHPVSMSTVSSPAMITRMLDKSMRTIMIDEADRALNPEKDGIADLLAILNSGYKRGATRPVLVPVKGGGWDMKEMPTFAPVVMAGNNPRLPDDTQSRSIRVLLLPDVNNAADESDWETIETDAETLRGRIESWVETVHDDVKAARPVLPEGITGRFREKWSPLRRVADAAGGRWPEIADRLAIDDREHVEMDKADGLIREKPAVLLLQHLIDVWPNEQSFVQSQTLVDLLCGKHPDQWGLFSPYGKPLSTQRLGSMLARTFKINTVRQSDGDRLRGYRMEHLLSVLQRMPPPPQETGRYGKSGRTGRETSGSSGPSGSLPSGSSDNPVSSGSFERGDDDDYEYKHPPCGLGHESWQACDNTNCHTFQACTYGPPRMNIYCPTCKVPLTRPNAECRASAWHQAA